MILVGDCRSRLREIETESVDSIVTDPPYELGFMGKSWDASGIAYDLDVWRECLRVLKPGGHLLAFSGSRTYHRMTVAIEDSGFEIRDQIMWLYGSGFPKSHDVSKAIDKLDAVKEQQERRFRFTAWLRSTGLTPAMIDHATGTQMGYHYTTHPTQPAIMTTEHLDAVRHLIGTVPEWVERECQIRSVESKQYASREVIGKASAPIGHAFAGSVYGGDSSNQEINITAPATPEAARWQGWGTALKPAHEPICVARKPLRGTVAQNVLAYGTGAINVDGCRVPTDDKLSGGHSSHGQMMNEGWHRPWMDDPQAVEANAARSRAAVEKAEALGRWPANVIHDGSEEVVGMFPVTRDRGNITPTKRTKSNGVTGWGIGPDGPIQNDAGGSAARFFYSAKASKADRDEGMEAWDEATPGQRTGGRADGSAGINAYAGTRGPARNVHPTVKPTDLMRYLVRLVTPPGGLVLDPFTGSGSTGKAAVLEGMRFIGCELSPEYSAIAEARIKAAAVKTGQVFEIPASPAPGRKAEAEQLRLFA